MYVHPLLNQDTAQKKILHEIKLSDTPPKPHSFNTTDFLMLLGPVSFIMGWAVLFVMLSKVGRSARDEIFTSIKHLQRVPCRNCRFFGNNPYLKCAINPSIVLTEQALECSDYQPCDSTY